MGNVNYGNVSLNTKYGSLLNCLGIQPVFVENGKIQSSYLGFAYRVSSYNCVGGKMHYCIKSRLGDENDIILKNAFHVNNSDEHVIRTLLQNSFTLKHNCSLDSLIQNDDLLKETIMYYLERIRYYISIGKGNFLITSRQDLYNKRLFTANEVSNFQVYMVDEKLLPQNMVIVGHKNSSAHANPYTAVPLIDKKHFDEICQMNGIRLDDIQVNTNKKLPMIDKYMNIYSLYQSYLDNVDVPYWYIETYNNPVKNRQKAYYTTLFFD